MAQNLSLLIISKFVFNPLQGKRFCYLGLDRNQDAIVRPVPALGPNLRDFFWLPNNDFEIGETHVFEVVPIQDPGIITYLPHRNNDVLVTYVGPDNDADVVDMPDMFDILYERARMSFEEALNIPDGHLLFSDNGRQYVKEGEDCQSLGICNPTNSELVIYETGRPFRGTGGVTFIPKRSFIIEVGRVFRPQTTE